MLNKRNMNRGMRLESVIESSRFFRWKWNKRVTNFGKVYYAFQLIFEIVRWESGDNRVKLAQILEKVHHVRVDEP